MLEVLVREKDEALRSVAKEIAELVKNRQTALPHLRQNGLQNNHVAEWRNLLLKQIALVNEHLGIHNQILVVVRIRGEGVRAASFSNAHVARFRVATHVVSHIHLLRTNETETEKNPLEPRASPFPSSS